MMREPDKPRLPQHDDNSKKQEEEEEWEDEEEGEEERDATCRLLSRLAITSGSLLR